MNQAPLPAVMHAPTTVAAAQTAKATTVKTKKVVMSWNWAMSQAKAMSKMCACMALMMHQMQSSNNGGYRLHHLGGGTSVLRCNLPLLWRKSTSCSGVPTGVAASCVSLISFHQVHKQFFDSLSSRCIA